MDGKFQIPMICTALNADGAEGLEGDAIVGAPQTPTSPPANDYLLSVRHAQAMAI
jgi:hypothetical protein